MRAFENIDELVAAKGEHLGFGEWHEVTQEQVNLFADATGDHQWIHVDVERARRESPFGGPIAHGYLTLSMGPRLVPQVVQVQGVRRSSAAGSRPRRPAWARPRPRR